MYALHVACRMSAKWIAAIAIGILTETYNYAMVQWTKVIQFKILLPGLLLYQQYDI